VGAPAWQNLVPLRLGGNQNEVGKSRHTFREQGDGVGYCNAGGGIVHIAELSKCADCMT
jgi:hypothetical protein